MIILALGSNVGDRVAVLRQAYAALASSVRIAAASAIYETGPRYVLDQPKFMNAALAVETALEPHDLLRLLKKTEDDLGRVKTMRNGPRLIDLDIVYYHSLAMETPDLVIPHPRRGERRFVLQPVSDIAGDFIDPVTHKTVRAMLAELDDADDVVRLNEAWHEAP